MSGWLIVVRRDIYGRVGLLCLGGVVKRATVDSFVGVFLLRHDRNVLNRRTNIGAETDSF